MAMRTPQRGRALHAKRKEWYIYYVLIARICHFLAVIVVIITQEFQEHFLQCLCTPEYIQE